MDQILDDVYLVSQVLVVVYRSFFSRWELVIFHVFIQFIIYWDLVGHRSDVSSISNFLWLGSNYNWVSRRRSWKFGWLGLGRKCSRYRISNRFELELYLLWLLIVSLYRYFKLPDAESRTSVHPVNRFYLFQVLYPWRRKTTRYFWVSEGRGTAGAVVEKQCFIMLDSIFFMGFLDMII